MIRIFSIISFYIIAHTSFAQTEDYRFAIQSYKDFSKLAGKPLSNTFAGVSAVKIVLRIEDEKLYFINSAKFPLHYTFCSKVFYFQELAEFNAVNYNDNASREYILATINFFRDANIFTLEFSPADDITKEIAEKVYHLVSQNFFDRNLFLQLSNSKLLVFTNWNIPVISVTELFKCQKLQIIQKGSASGRLIKVNADSLDFLGDVRDCILLLQGNSNDIPLCKGIIASSFQTPLSHISILSQNRKTPLIAFKEIAKSETLKPFLDHYINLSVSEDTFFIRFDSTLRGLDNKNTTLVKLNLDTVRSLVSLLKKIKVKDTGAYGAKAVNLAQLQRVRYKGKCILTPEGAFAIPVFYYWQHIRKSGADTIISGLLKTYKTISKRDLQTHLVRIRESIRKSKIDMDLICAVEQLIKSAGVGQRYRFRSSSNAEDLNGFNGAGLYTSETGIVGKSKSIESAIKKVWASLWSERAFEERCLANIDQNTVGMAILGHRSFPDEYANGVAITKNLYRDFDFGFVVNLQLGDNSLVKPEGEETCEQFITYFNTADPFFNEKDAIEYLSFSSLNNNNPILSREEIFELTQQLDCIKQRFFRVTKGWKSTSYKNFAMDVEFKAEIKGGKKVFYFKQARPF